jgi:hypothetical protein
MTNADSNISGLEATPGYIYTNKLPTTSPEMVATTITQHLELFTHPLFTVKLRFSLLLP